MFGVEESYDREGTGPADGTQPPAPAAPPTQDAVSEDQPSQAPQPGPSQPMPAQPPQAEPPQPAPPTSPQPGPTGHERVDAALARLDELAAAPVADHVEVFEDVQRGLQDALASIDHDETRDDDAPGGGS